MTRRPGPLLALVVALPLLALAGTPAAAAASPSVATNSAAARTAPAATAPRAVPAAAPTKLTVYWPRGLVWNATTSVTVRTTPGRAGRLVTVRASGGQQKWTAQAKARTNRIGAAALNFRILCLKPSCPSMPLKLTVTVAAGAGLAAATASKTITIRRP